MGSVYYNLIIKIQGNDTHYHQYTIDGEKTSIPVASETLYNQLWNNRDKLTTEVRNVGILGSNEHYDIILYRFRSEDNQGEALQINKKTGRVRKGTWIAGPVH